MSKQNHKLALIDREKRIMELISKGHPAAEIFELVASEFAISPRTVERNYYSVVDAIGRASNARKQELRTILLARQDRIYRQALENGDLSLALSVTDKMAKVGGLYEPSKNEDAVNLPTVIEYYPKADDETES